MEQREISSALDTKGRVSALRVRLNESKGIYACLAESATTDGLHYVINRANVLCLGKWIVGEKVALDIIDRWLSAEIGAGFNEERRRVQAAGFQKIVKIEEKKFK